MGAHLVEDLEGLEDLLLRVGVLHLARHESQELGEVDGPVSVGIDLWDRGRQLSECGIRSLRPTRQKSGAASLDPNERAANPRQTMRDLAKEEGRLNRPAPH